MAKWVSSSVLDNGLNQIKNNCTRMILISTYTAGDSYATVTAAALATVTMVSADFTLGSSASDRTLTVASGKTATASATAAAGDRHIAFTDGTANVLWVTDETTNQAITSGNTVNFPAPVYTAQQPT